MKIHWDSVVKFVIKSRLMLGLVVLMMMAIGLWTSLIMRRIIYSKLYSVGMHPFSKI
jgi:hypothetical protein